MPDGVPNVGALGRAPARVPAVPFIYYYVDESAVAAVESINFTQSVGK